MPAITNIPAKPDPSPAPRRTNVCYLGLTPEPVEKPNGNTGIGGGAYVTRDSKLFQLQPSIHDALYNGPTGGPDTFKVFKDNRNDQLDDFVKLVIVSRWGLVSPGPNVPLTAATPTVCKVPNEGPAEAKVAASHPTSGDQTWEGALVAATGIAEEATVLHGGGHYTQAEFLNVMSWSVAHEVGHLLVGAEHPGTSSTALMGLPPGPGRQGISVIQTDVTEMSMMDLKDKNSVNE